MKDSDFIKGEKVPMTKEEIRYISIGYLDIVSRKKMLDIGSGTGTVSIESLMHNKNLFVTAIEIDDVAYSTTLMNIEKYDNEYTNIKNRIKLIKAEAPCEIEDKFDAIFVGGTKGSVKEIIQWSSELLETNGILVLNFITLENFYEAISAIESNKSLTDVEGSQVMINKIENIAKYKYLKPHNPVFVIKCLKK